MRWLLAVPALLLVAPAVAAPGGPTVAEVDRMSRPSDNIVEDVTATASTTLCEKKPKLCHGPEALLDYKEDTAWCEGLPGDGTGATITLTLAKPQKLASVFVLPQFAKSFALAEQNARVASLEIATDEGVFTAKLDDMVPIVRKENTVKEDEADCGEPCMSRDQRIQVIGNNITFGHFAQGDHGDFVEKPVTTSKVVLTLRGVYPGKKFKDTCISTIDLHRAP